MSSRRCWTKTWAEVPAAHSRPRRESQTGQQQKRRYPLPQIRRIILRIFLSKTMSRLFFEKAPRLGCRTVAGNPTLMVHKSFFPRTRRGKTSEISSSCGRQIFAEDFLTAPAEGYSSAGAFCISGKGGRRPAVPSSLSSSRDVGASPAPSPMPEVRLAVSK